MSKRYFFSVVEEMVMNPDYEGLRGGRIEVFDEKDDSGYQIYEARFLIPEEIFPKFRDMFEYFETDIPPEKIHLRWSFDRKEKK